MSAKPNHEERLFSALAYPFWYVTFPVFLLSKDRQASSFQRYHCHQGLFLGLALWLGGIALWNVAAILGKFILFGLLLYPLLRLAEWFALGITIYCAASAWLGYRVRLPFLSDFVKPFAEVASSGESE